MRALAQMNLNSPGLKAGFVFPARRADDPQAANSRFDAHMNECPPLGSG